MCLKKRSYTDWETQCVYGIVVIQIGNHNVFMES